MVGIRLTPEFHTLGHDGVNDRLPSHRQGAASWNLLCGQGFPLFIQPIPIYLLVKYWQTESSHELSEPAHAHVGLCRAGRSPERLPEENRVRVTCKPTEVGNGHDRFLRQGDWIRAVGH